MGDAFYTDTLSKLESMSKITDKVIVAYSGGKDSLAVLELAKLTFKNVLCFFMYLVPDLQVNKNIVDYVKNKFNVECLEYPHWLYFQLKHNGIYCNGDTKIKMLKLKDIFAMVRSDTGYEYIMTGYKKVDSMSRRRIVSCMNKGEYTNVVWPIWEWNMYDVLAFLKIKNIEIPFQMKANTAGVDLSTDSILWFYDNMKEDYEIIKSHFPFIEAKVKQREFYGIK